MSEKTKLQKTMYNKIPLYKAQKQEKINMTLFRSMCICGCNEEMIITIIKRLVTFGMELPLRRRIQEGHTRSLHGF